jgi:hypothetical protein
LATKAQRKESVFEELEGGEEETIMIANMTAFGELLAGTDTSMAASNDTAPTIVIIDDVTGSSSQFNSTSSSSSTEAVAI